MPSRLARSELLLLFGGLTGANAVVWAWAIVAFHGYPVLLGTALLAYSFGLRHAVDADHIAAIDNVTRKLMQGGRRAECTGLFFSLGHSTVVVLASLGIALGAGALSYRFPEVRAAGGVIGTILSAVFLFGIAIANLFILVGIYRAFRRARDCKCLRHEELELMCSFGPLSRIFGPLLRLIGSAWQMYPLGVLFGLGFDTATEIGVLGISAAEAAKGLSIWSMLIFPALFTSGMALVDTFDSVLMSHAYGWAFVRPVRKLYYNLTLTAGSVVAALLVGSVEALGLMSDRFSLKGSFWNLVSTLNNHFGMIGYLIIGLFAASWLISLAVYRLKGFDNLAIELASTTAAP